MASRDRGDNDGCHGNYHDNIHKTTDVPEMSVKIVFGPKSKGLVIFNGNNSSNLLKFKICLGAAQNWSAGRGLKTPAIGNST